MRDGQRFNVVLAQAPGFNAGMAAVDLGLLAAAQELGFEPTPWRLGSLSERAHARAPDLDHQMDMGLGQVRHIWGNWPDELTDPILFWGDFHHMATYVNDVGRIIGSPLGGHNAARRYLLLEGVPEETKRQSASYGTTLVFNTNQDFRRGPYSTALHDLLSCNAVTLFRDPISTQLVRRVRPDGSISTGVDPALLIEPQQIPSLRPRAEVVGVFLGRSPSTHPGLWEVAQKVARALRARAWNGSTGATRLGFLG